VLSPLLRHEAPSRRSPVDRPEKCPDGGHGLPSAAAALGTPACRRHAAAPWAAADFGASGDFSVCRLRRPAPRVSYDRPSWHWRASER